MPALKPTDFYAEVLWLGLVADSMADISAAPVEEMTLGFDGAVGDCHSGLTRPSCSRVRAQHKRGTEIANSRQLSILSAEELEEVAETIGIEEFDPAWVGASIILRGLPDFSHLPPSSRLQADTGATLVVDMQNRPCVLPGRLIEKDHPEAGKAFKAAAEGKRGIVAWVERPGMIRVGDILRLHVPDQRGWNALEEARAQ